MGSSATNRSETTKDPRKKKSAFTLMEVLIAIALISIGLFGVVAAQAFAVRSEFKNGLRFEAGAVAGSILERAEQTLASDFEADLSRQDITFGNFIYSVEQTSGSDPDFADQLQRVTVRVRWSDDQGDRDYTLWTEFVRP